MSSERLAPFSRGTVTQIKGSAAWLSGTRLASDTALLTRCRVEQKWPQQLWIVRHGQSAGNVARDSAEAARLPLIDIAERDIDVPLSPLGEQQSIALGQWFGRQPRAAQPNVVLCSPYIRARSTARLALEAAGIAADSHILQADERLREKEFGILDRLNWYSRASSPVERAACARRQVLFPPPRWRKLVRRDPAATQRD